MNAGSIVRCRNRDWVLLPSEDEELILLRPLTGATDEVVAVHRRISDLLRYTLKEETLEPSQFKPPTVDDLADASSAHLLWHAARLTLREGATPFRSLGKISIRPRIYQFVPLLMALSSRPCSIANRRRRWRRQNRRSAPCRSRAARQRRNQANLCALSAIPLRAVAKGVG